MRRGGESAGLFCWIILGRRKRRTIRINPIMGVVFVDLRGPGMALAHRNDQAVAFRCFGGRHHIAGRNQDAHKQSKERYPS